MDKRNLTLNLPANLVRQAKIYAAEHDTTINSLIRDLLQEKLTRESRVQSAVDKILALAERGPFFSADLSLISREALHERQ